MLATDGEAGAAGGLGLLQCSVAGRPETDGWVAAGCSIYTAERGG